MSSKQTRIKQKKECGKLLLKNYNRKFVTHIGISIFAHEFSEKIETFYTPLSKKRKIILNKISLAQSNLV